MPEIIILGRVEYAPADRARYLAHIDELVVATRHEPGVRRYEIVADPHSATGVLVMEHYASSEGLEAHRSSAHLKRFRSQTEVS